MRSLDPGQGFAHLHVRSGFSYGFGVATPAELTTAASEMGMKALALTDTVLEVDPNRTRVQDSPHVLGHILRCFRISPFHVGGDGNVYGRGDAAHDVQHCLERDLLAIIVAQGVGDRGTRRGHCGIAQPFHHAGAARVPDVREDEDAARVMERA